MRATIETHENSDQLPPVHVLVSRGDEDVSIKVQIRNPSAAETIILKYSSCKFQ